MALLQSSEHHTDGSTSVIKKKVALYEIYNDQITAEAFASKFGENFTIEFPETLDDMDVFENVSVEKSPMIIWVSSWLTTKAQKIQKTMNM